MRFFIFILILLCMAAFVYFIIRIVDRASKSDLEKDLEKGERAKKKIDTLYKERNQTNKEDQQKQNE